MQKIKIHPLFWVTILIGIITASFKEIMILFGIVFIHELGHALTANFFGWRIKKIELLPFGGVAEVDEYGNKPLKEDIFVQIMGPLQHVWIFLLCKLLFMNGMIEEELYLYTIYNNFSILCFNLLPIWPLDGGKILFSLLSIKIPFTKAHFMVIVMSSILTFVFVIGILLLSPTNISLWFMVLFLMFSIWKDWKQRNYIFIRFLLGRFQNKALKVEKIYASKEDNIFRIFYMFQRGARHEIIVGERKFQEIELINGYFQSKKMRMSELFSE